MIAGPMRAFLEVIARDESSLITKKSMSGLTVSLLCFSVACICHSDTRSAETAMIKMPRLRFCLPDS